jgi:hypothetical protein
MVYSPAVEAKDYFVRGFADPPILDEQPSANLPPSTVTPEEGRRLIRAFLQIESVALRAAIIKLVTEMSASSPKGAAVGR